jgi:hypothetical protein
MLLNISVGLIHGIDIRLKTYVLHQLLRNFVTAETGHDLSALGDDFYVGTPSVGLAQGQET